MGTVAIRPHDCLGNPLHANDFRPKSRRNSINSPRPYRDTSKSPIRTIPKPPKSARKVHHGVVRRPPCKELVMGEVKILQRGENAIPPESDFKPKALGEDPIGLEPVPYQIAFAGSALSSSPRPSDLPMPTSFLLRKDLLEKVDLATKGLRYLRLLDLS